MINANLVKISGAMRRGTDSQLVDMGRKVIRDTT